MNQLIKCQKNVKDHRLSELETPQMYFECHLWELKVTELRNKQKIGI